MVSTTPQNYHGKIIKRGNSMGITRKEMVKGKIRKKDRVFSIKDLIPEDKDSIPCAQDSIFSTKNDKNSNQSWKRNLGGIFSQGSILTK